MKAQEPLLHSPFENLREDRLVGFRYREGTKQNKIGLCLMWGDLKDFGDLQRGWVDGLTPHGVAWKAASLRGRARLCEQRERPPWAGLINTTRDHDLQQPQPQPRYQHSSQSVPGLRRQCLHSETTGGWGHLPLCVMRTYRLLVCPGGSPGGNRCYSSGFEENLKMGRVKASNKRR